MAFRRFSILLVLMPALVSVQAFGQVTTGPVIPGASDHTYGQLSPAPSDDKKYTVSGTVVNSVTGEGIPRAQVSVGPFSMMTDSSGAFSFEGVTAGNFRVSAQKPGYFSQGARSPGQWFTPMQV